MLTNKMSVKDSNDYYEKSKFKIKEIEVWGVTFKE
jgi:hypothetical protein